MFRKIGQTDKNRTKRKTATKAVAAVLGKKRRVSNILLVDKYFTMRKFKIIPFVMEQGEFIREEALDPLLRDQLNQIGLTFHEDFPGLSCTYHQHFTFTITVRQENGIRSIILTCCCEQFWGQIAERFYGYPVGVLLEVTHPYPPWFPED